MNPTANLPAPVPFHDDPRTLREKLATEKLNWEPHRDPDSPQSIYGLVLERGVFVSKYVNQEDAPTARVLARENGSYVEWTVVGFHGWLRSELTRKDPRVGDFAAFAYQGLPGLFVQPAHITQSQAKRPLAS